MSQYPNYRVSVEIVILHNGKVLLTKRNDAAGIEPGVWSVPAGKVKYEEIPVAAVHREAKEETNLDIELIRELDVRAIKLKSKAGDVFRLMYTYLVKPKNGDVKAFAFDDEHSEYAWVKKDDLMGGKYNSLHANLRETLISIL